MKTIAVIGAGRVGLVTAACLAHLGNRVTCIERSPFYLQSLRSGRLPFFEPQLGELVQDSVASGTLFFSNSIEDGLRGASAVFLCVGTPQGPDGAVDLSDAERAAHEIGRSLSSDICIVSKSTVPAGANDRLLSIVQAAARSAFRVTIVSNPEFLREGSAVADFLAPDRIVIGVRRADDAALLKDLYASFSAPVIVTDIRAAGADKGRLQLLPGAASFFRERSCRSVRCAEGGRAERSSRRRHGCKDRQRLSPARSGFRRSVPAERFAGTDRRRAAGGSRSAADGRDATRKHGSR